MSPAALKHPKGLSGHGHVFLRGGHVWEGRVEIADTLLTMHGRLRIRNGDQIIYHDLVFRSWPLREVREVRWQEPPRR